MADGIPTTGGGAMSITGALLAVAIIQVGDRWLKPVCCDNTWELPLFPGRESAV